ncbi:MAG: DUF2703 domain-containing protein [bacterium]|nr:DUF2703 domain-containing protein [bacterium]
MENMKALKIRWVRLVSDGKTCTRCESTEKELEKAVSILKQSLTPLGIEVIFEKEAISVEEFKENTLLSNQIWINDVSLEELVEGKVGKSKCCDVCGPSECRTIEIDEKVYEAIPAELIIKGGLFASSQLITEKTDQSCCKPENSKKSSKCCCPE